MRVEDRAQSGFLLYRACNALGARCKCRPLVFGQPMFGTNPPGILLALRHTAVVIGQDDHRLGPGRIGEKPRGADGDVDPRRMLMNTCESNRTNAATRRRSRS